MPEKQNQRVMLTKQLIYRAFLSMLQRTEIHKVSIRELCELAGINRTTFYKHYGSQYDVLDEMTANFLSDTSAAIEEANLQDSEDVRSRVTVVLRYMEQNIDLAKMLLNHNTGGDFALKLLQIPKITDMIEEALRGSENTVDNNSIIRFTVYGALKLIQDWINDDKRLPAEQEAKIILTLASRVFLHM